MGWALPPPPWDTGPGSPSAPPGHGTGHGTGMGPPSAGSGSGRALELPAGRSSSRTAAPAPGLAGAQKGRYGEKGVPSLLPRPALGQP